MKFKTNKVYNSENLLIMQSVSEIPTSDFELHCHTKYEILYIIEGDISYLIEGRAYSPVPGSLLLIPPNTFHGVRIDSTHVYRRLCVHFEKEILTETEQNVFLSTYDQTGAYYPVVTPYQIEQFMQPVFETFKFPAEMQETVFQARICSLLSQLCLLRLKENPVLTEPDPRISQILLYINDHLTEPLSLEAISERFFISKNHLNVRFRQATGTTVNQYIRLKRLALAQQHIREGIPLQRSAEMAGFSDYSNFYKAYFKHYGKAPSSQLIPGFPFFSLSDSESK